MAFTGTMWLGTQDYAAEQDRMFAVGLWQTEGVLPPVGGDPQSALIVSPGAGLTVGIAPGWAIVRGSARANQGVYADYNEGAYQNFSNPYGTASASPRVDLVVIQVNDSEVAASTPADQTYPRWVRGTETAGADPNNQAFWPTRPPTSLVIASVLVRVGASSFTSNDISDQRKLSGPQVWGEDGTRYRLGVDSNGNIGLEALT